MDPYFGFIPIIIITIITYLIITIIYDDIDHGDNSPVEQPVQRGERAGVGERHERPQQLHAAGYHHQAPPPED